MNLTPRQRAGIAGGVLSCCALAGAALKPFEGRSNTVYPDVVLGWKAPTICDGHVDKTLKPGAHLTDAECDQLLHADLRATYDQLADSSCLGDVALEDYEMAAFLSASYNFGAATFCKGSFKSKLAAGDHVGACNLLLQYRFVGGKDCADAVNNCRGIVRRREAERTLCLGEA